MLRYCPKIHEPNIVNKIECVRDYRDRLSESWNGVSNRRFLCDSSPVYLINNADNNVSLLELHTFIALSKADEDFECLFQLAVGPGALSAGADQELMILIACHF